MPITEEHSPVARIAAPPVRTAESADDLALIEALVRHDDGAWSRFVHGCQRLILSRVLQTLRQCGHQDDHAFAEDICADIFAMLLADDCEQLRRFEGRSKLSTWLAVIARRVTLRRLSQHRAAAPTSLTHTPIDEVASTADTLKTLQREEAAHLHTAMQRLSETDQAVLRSFYFEHQSYTQIADQLDVSVNTVGPKLHRAQQRLKQILCLEPAEHPLPSDP